MREITISTTVYPLSLESEVISSLLFCKVSIMYFLISSVFMCLKANHHIIFFFFVFSFRLMKILALFQRQFKVEHLVSIHLPMYQLRGSSFRKILWKLGTMQH